MLCNEPAPLIVDFLTDMSGYNIGEYVHAGEPSLLKAVDKGTGDPVLVKRFSSFPRGRKDFDLALREVRFLTVKNPLFVEMLGFSVCDEQTDIVLRNAVNGVLACVLIDEYRGKVRPGWDATSKSKCIFGIAAAMKTVHSRGYIHKTLKPYNIFLDENFEPLLGGFERASEFLPAVEFFLGEIAFQAPEIMDHQSYDYKVDVFTFGITVFCLLAGRYTPHLTVEDPLRLRDRIVQEELRPNLDEIPNVSSFLVALMKQCWDADPQARPSSREIVELLHANTEEYILPGSDLRAVKEYESRVLATGVLSQ